MNMQKEMETMTCSQPRYVDLMEVRRRHRESTDELRQQGHLVKKGTKQRKMVTQDSYGRQIAYNDYILQAWGRASHDEEKRKLTTDWLHRSRTSAVPDEYAPELSPRERRPRISVTIPQRPSSSRQVVHKPIAATNASSKEGTPSTVSPPSTTTRAYEIAPARLSIVSPLSVVEMPRPRRPFSTHSIENMSSNLPRSAPLLKNKAFDSSDDSTGHDDKSSNYSQSSMSTLHSDDGLMQHSEKVRANVAFSVCSPSAAGIFDAPPGVPKVPQKPRSLVVLNDAVKNKPLPPEPGLRKVTPFANPSITSLKRHNSPAPLKISRTATVSSCRASTVSSLRSKYSPTNLDKLDEAFQKISPLHLQSAGSHLSSQTLRQAELDLEAHLGTIEEHSVTLALPSLDDPLQIKRGAGDMVPSRPAPSPPESAASGNVSSPKKRFPRRAASHIVSMMRPSDEHARSRTSVARSMAKVQKVLGENTGMEMERQGSAESNWSSSESRSPPNSSPNVSTWGDTTTSETDVSSIPDQTYEEVKARLDLLSPTEDASTTFFAIHGALGSQATPLKTPNHDPSKQAYLHPTEAVPNIVVAPLKIPHSPPNDLKQAPEPAQGRQQYAKSVRSLGSIAASEIRDLYASLPSPVPTLPPIPSQEKELFTAEEMESMISADAAERVLLRILENIDNLQDLFSAATVSRGFYRTFKRHELPLMKNALFSMSAAAWELREMSSSFSVGEDGRSSSEPGYTPTTYLQDYMEDMYTMIALKSMILIHCESFLRVDTIKALAGGETDRAAEIDDAFWRVWTFCKLFGHGTNREDDIVSQMDWLRGGPLEKKQQAAGSRTFLIGFGRGNGKSGLSADALYDMTEIWTCMGVLVRGLQAKRQLARDYGVFDSSDIASGDVQKEDTILEEWTYHILTRAPPAVLDVTGPSSPTSTTFAHARSRGYTHWSPPGVSRSTFLKEAVSRVYEERMAARRYPITNTQSPVRSSPTSPEQRQQQTWLPDATLVSRQRCANHAAEIRRARRDPNFRALPPSEERPMSNWPDVFDKLEYSPSPPPPPMPPIPQFQTGMSSQAGYSCAVAAPSISTPNLHAPRGPQELNIRPFLSTSNSFSSAYTPAGPQVRDPVDVAIDRLVAMGFDEKKSQKALADTDNGNGIDFDEAVEVLVRERKRDVNNMMHWGYRGRKEQVVDPNCLGGDTLISVVGNNGTGIGAIGRSASGGPPVRYN